LANPKRKESFSKNSKYRRKLNKKPLVSLLTNYSDINTTPATVSVFDRGLNFAIIPNKVPTATIYAGF